MSLPGCENSIRNKSVDFHRLKRFNLEIKSKAALNKERLQFEFAVCFININIIYFELIHIIAEPSEVPPTAEEQPEQDILDKGKNNKSIMRIRKHHYKWCKFEI